MTAVIVSMSKPLSGLAANFADNNKLSGAAGAVERCPPGDRCKRTKAAARIRRSHAGRPLLRHSLRVPYLERGPEVNQQRIVVAGVGSHVVEIGRGAVELVVGDGL